MDEESEMMAMDESQMQHEMDMDGSMDEGYDHHMHEQMDDEDYHEMDMEGDEDQDAMDDDESFGFD